MINTPHLDVIRMWYQAEGSNTLPEDFDHESMHDTVHRILTRENPFDTVRDLLNYLSMGIVVVMTTSEPGVSTGDISESYVSALLHVINQMADEMDRVEAGRRE